MEAVELVHRHLPGLKRGFFLILGELADHQVLRQDFLLRESGGVDFTQPEDVVEAARELLVVSLDGVVGELVVEAVVADGGGKLRRVAEAVLPDLGEEIVERLAARGNVRGLCSRSSLRVNAGRDQAGTTNDQGKSGEDAEFHH